MHELDSDRPYLTAGQMPGQSHKRGNKKFHLVAIDRARNTDILASHRNVLGLPIGDVHSFIMYCAISRDPSQRVAECLGRGLDIVQQPQFPKLKVLGKPKSEKFV
jgi:hypothetical protein